MKKNQPDIIWFIPIKNEISLRIVTFDAFHAIGRTYQRIIIIFDYGLRNKSPAYEFLI